MPPTTHIHTIFYGKYRVKLCGLIYLLIVIDSIISQIIILYYYLMMQFEILLFIYIGSDFRMGILKYMMIEFWLIE